MTYDPKHIARNVEWFRTRREWTRAELGERLGVSRQFVTKIETGAKVPSAGRVCELCGVLECSPGELMSYRRTG